MKIIIVLLLISFIIAPKVWACSCMGPDIERSSIAFLGEVLNTSGNVEKALSDLSIGPQRSVNRFGNHYSVLKVHEVYKGIPGNKINIFYVVGDENGCGMQKLKKKAKYIIFAHLNNDGLYTTGYCSGNIQVDNKESVRFSGLIQHLNSIKSSLDEVDRSIQNNHGALEPYLKKAEILISIADFQRLELVYADALRVASPDKIGVVYEGYGEALYNLGRYKEAIPLLKKAHTNKAKGLYQASLAYAGQLKELDGQKVNLSGLTLEDIDFSGLDIQEADFSATRLTDVKFSGANLAKANFNHAKIRGENDFTNANLTDANLSDSEITGNFSNSNLANTHAKNMKFTGELIGVDLRNANLEGAKIHSIADANTKLENTNLSGAILSGSNFDNVDFRNASLKGTDLSSSKWAETNLGGANLAAADLAGAKFTATKYDCKTKFPAGFNPRDYLMVLRETCEDDGVLSNSAPSFSRRHLLSPPNGHYRLLNLAESMNFKDLDLSGVDFEGANIGRFERVNLTNANFSYTTGSAEIFSSNLENADFSYSNLSRLRLEGNILKGAKFYCANLNHLMDLKKTILEADLTASIFNNRNFQEWPHDFDPIKNKVLFRFMQQVIDKYGVADYSNMDFKGCNLRDIDFGTTNLSGSKFKGALFYRTDFTRANIEDANFDGARVEDAQFPPSFDFKNHKLIPTSIMNANSSPWAASYGGLVRYNSTYRQPFTLEVPNFPAEDLSGMDFTASWLPSANMQKVNIDFSNFSASNLSDADFSDSSAKGAIFYDAVLDGANFKNADLTGADLRKATLPDAILENTNLKDAVYDSKTIWPLGFDPLKAGAFQVQEPKKSD